MEDGESKRPVKIGRREAIKGAVFGALGLGVVAAGAREIHNGQEGVETADGVFFGLYERHDRGIHVADLPPNLDGLFREGSFTEFSTNHLFDQSNYGENVPWVPPQILEVLAKDKTKILLGDLDIGEPLLNQSRLGEVGVFATGLAMAAAGSIYNLVDEIRGVYKDEADPKLLGRRKFIKNAAYIAGGVATTPRILETFHKVPLLLGHNSDLGNALDRLYIRLGGLNSHAIPEDHLLFFRNLIMADKIMTAAEAFGQNTDHKPRIAFNVGGGHAGMEDFLALGHDFTRWLIAQYPKSFLGEIIRVNGGLENVCSAQAITIPSNFTANLVENKNESDLSAVQNNLKSQSAIERIVDQPLLQMLSAKFEAEEQESRQKREAEINELRSLYKKHLSPEMYSQVEKYFNEVSVVSPRTYGQMVAIDELPHEGSVFKGSYTSLSPKESKIELRSNPDMYTNSQVASGQMVYEQISLFINKNGQLVANRNNPYEVVIPQDQLKNAIKLVFSNTPIDEDSWDYIPAGTASTPYEGQALLRYETPEDKFPNYRYQISQDGRVEVAVRYKPNT